MKKGKGEVCDSSRCPKCGGYAIIIIGALVILNEMYSTVSWPMFVGIIGVLVGLKHTIMCSCCCK